MDDAPDVADVETEPGTDLEVYEGGGEIEPSEVTITATVTDVPPEDAEVEDEDDDVPVPEVDSSPSLGDYAPANRGGGGGGGLGGGKLSRRERRRRKREGQADGKAGVEVNIIRLGGGNSRTTNVASNNTGIKTGRAGRADERRKARAERRGRG